MRNYIIAAILSMSLFTSLQAQTTDYSKISSWFQELKDTSKNIDVLFFPPTATSDIDGTGHNMDTSNPKQRQAMDYWYSIGKAIFGESCNFYGPYYSQATMESWARADFPQIYAVALRDAQAAFDYYMKHYNNGRPFILAGHSQGARIVYSLIKSRINSRNYPQMVAAYPIGYRVTADDLAESPYIRPAKGVCDIGVCISYHSAASSQAAMYPGNAFSINPLNWKTDTTTAGAALNMGSLFFDNNGKVVKEFTGTITAQIDPRTGCLLVTGLDPDEFFKPYVGGSRFKRGNYHLQDLNIFLRNLQQNVQDRVASYLYNKQKR